MSEEVRNNAPVKNTDIQADSTVITKNPVSAQTASRGDSTEAEVRLDATQDENAKRREAILTKKRAELLYAEGEYQPIVRTNRGRNNSSAGRRAALQREAQERRAGLAEEERLRLERLRAEAEEAMRRNTEADTLVHLATARATAARNNEYDNHTNGATSSVNVQISYETPVQSSAEVTKEPTVAEPEEHLEDSVNTNTQNTDAVPTNAHRNEEFMHRDEPKQDEIQRTDTQHVTTEKKREVVPKSTVVIQDGIEFIKGFPGEEASEITLSDIAEGVTFTMGITEADERCDSITDPETGFEFIRGIPEPNWESQGMVLTFDEQEIMPPSAPVQEQSEVDMVLSMDAETFLNEEPTEYSAYTEATVGEHTPTPESVTTDVGQVPDKKPPLNESIFGSTYEMMTKRSDFIDGYVERKASAEAAIRRSTSARSHSPEPPYCSPTKKPTYKYSAGNVIRPDGNAARKKKIRSGFAAPTDFSADTENVTLSATEPVAGGYAAPVSESQTAATTEAPVEQASNPAPARTDARLNALLAEKARLETMMLQIEEQNREEIALLLERNNEAKISLITAQFRAREETLRREINELNAKIRELEVRHSENRAILEDSIRSYRSDEISLGYTPAPRSNYEYSADSYYGSSPASNAPDGNYSYYAPGTATSPPNYNGAEMPDSGARRRAVNNFYTYGEMYSDGQINTVPTDIHMPSSAPYTESASRDEIIADYENYKKRYPDGNRNPEFTDANNPTVDSYTGAQMRRSIADDYEDYARAYPRQHAEHSAPVTDIHHGGETPYRDGGYVPGERIPAPQRNPSDEFDEFAYTSEYDRHRAEAPDAEGVREYENRRLLEDYNRHNESRAMETELDFEAAELDKSADQISRQQSVLSMKKRDLTRHLSSSFKREKKLIKVARRAYSKQKRTTGSARMLLLKESIDSNRELLKIYIENLRYSIASKHKKYKKLFSKKIDALVKEFNNKLILWQTLTGTHIPPLPLSLSKDIIAGNSIPKIPSPHLDGGLAEEAGKKRLSRIDLRDMRREQIKLAREEAQREREERRSNANGTAADNGSVTKKHMERDIKTVTARIEYRINKYAYEVSRSKFRFGEETGREKRERKKAIAKLKRMKSSGKAVIKYARRNNARYMEIASTDAESAFLRRSADRERLQALIDRIRLLLIERDGINERLAALYAENENALAPGKSTKNRRKKIISIKLSKSKKTFRSQMRDYRKIDSYRIPLKKKQELYDLMNKKTELLSYYTELKFRIKTEHPRGEAKAVLRREMKSTRRQLKYLEYDFKRLRKKTAKRAKKEPNPKAQIFWLIFLTVIVAVLVFGFIFFKSQIGAFVEKIIQWFSNNFGSAES